jgi:hypothetical protein
MHPNATPILAAPASNLPPVTKWRPSYWDANISLHLESASARDLHPTSGCHDEKSVVLGNDCCWSCGRIHDVPPRGTHGFDRRANCDQPGRIAGFRTGNGGWVTSRRKLSFDPPQRSTPPELRRLCSHRLDQVSSRPICQKQIAISV